MRDCDFFITGSRDKGHYVVKKKGEVEPMFENFRKHSGGLKEARQKIGEYLQSRGKGLNKVFTHQTIVPGRKVNPTHEWTVEEYLIGVPLKKSQ